MTAVTIWFGMSIFATVGIVSSLALSSRRDIPALDTDSVPEPMFILNRGLSSAGGDSKLASSFAQ